MLNYIKLCMKLHTCVWKTFDLRAIWMSVLTIMPTYYKYKYRRYLQTVTKHPGVQTILC